MQYGSSPLDATNSCILNVYPICCNIWVVCKEHLHIINPTLLILLLKKFQETKRLNPYVLTSWGQSKPSLQGDVSADFVRIHMPPLTCYDDGKHVMVCLPDVRKGPVCQHLQSPKQMIFQHSSRIPNKLKDVLLLK